MKSRVWACDVSPRQANPDRDGVPYEGSGIECRDGRSHAFTFTGCSSLKPSQVQLLIGDGDKPTRLDLFCE